MKSPKDVLELGKAIVRELELDDHGSVLERWLAHHLAQLMSEADRTVGASKTAAEQQAVDLILKLWMHRRALPEPVDPLGGYRRAIEVLSRLKPEADPWKRYRQNGTYEDLLHETFQALSRITIGGIVLTQVSRRSPVSEVESRALEHEEAILLEELERWMSFVTTPPQTPRIDIQFVGVDSIEEPEVPQDSDLAGQDDLESEQQAEPTEATFHSAIIENLERLESDLGTLLTRWRNSAPNEVARDRVESASGAVND